MHLLYILVQFCWYYKKSEKVRFFLLWKSFLVSKGTNYQIIQGIRGDNTILDNLQPFCLLSEHSHILAMSISYVEGGTLCISNNLGTYPVLHSLFNILFYLKMKSIFSHEFILFLRWKITKVLKTQLKYQQARSDPIGTYTYTKSIMGVGLVVT